MVLYSKTRKSDACYFVFLLVVAKCKCMAYCILYNIQYRAYSIVWSIQFSFPSYELRIAERHSEWSRLFRIILRSSVVLLLFLSRCIIRGNLNPYNCSFFYAFQMCLYASAFSQVLFPTGCFVFLQYKKKIKGSF